MKILLISSNPTIEKLFTLSAGKNGDDVVIGSKDFIPEGNFEAVFIDKDFYSEDLFNELKEKFSDAKFILILSKKDEKIEGFDDYIIKPFLPTDLIDFISSLENNEKQEKEIEFDDLDGDLSLDDLDKDTSLDIEELEDLDDDVLVEENELLDSLDENNEKNEVADLDKIENKDENDEIDNLDEEILDNNLDENDDIQNSSNENIEEDLEAEIEDEILDEEQTENAMDFLEKNEDNLDSLDEAVIEDENRDEDISEKMSDTFEEENNILKEDKSEEIDELTSLDEKDLAKVLGEEIEEIEEDSKENKENQDNVDIETENISNNEIKEATLDFNSENEKSIEEKTLGNILNINWEELKKAKAKVTITIDFGE
jgi:DNA-binding response OmpR family regulator